MTELKTLKDITKDFCNMKLINVQELKAEAIKWVKSAWNVSETLGEKEWFNFFNIKEEDLK